jgi:hypothetical protein
MAKSDPWVRVTSFPNVHEASLAQSALQAAGIETKVFNQHALGAMPHLNQMMEADVMVLHSNFKEAREILGLDAEAVRPTEPPLEGEKEKILRFAASAAVIGLVILPGVSGLLSLAHLFRAYRVAPRGFSAQHRGRLFLSLFCSILGIVGVTFLLVFIYFP